MNSVHDYFNIRKSLADPFTTSPVVAGIARPEWVVDCGFILNPLARWTRRLGTLTLSDTGSSNGQLTALFTVNNNDTLRPVSFNMEFRSPNLTAKDITVWSEAVDLCRGFVTFGALDSVSPSVATSNPQDCSVLPAATVTLYNHRIESIGVANAYSAIYSDIACFPAPVGGTGFAVESSNMRGDITLEAGAFMAISLRDDNNSVEFSTIAERALRGDLPCTSQRILPLGYSTLNEPRCIDLLFTVNGTGPIDVNGTLTIIGRTGVTVEPVAGTSNTLRLTFLSGTLYGGAVPRCSSNSSYDDALGECVAS